MSVLLEASVPELIQATWKWPAGMVPEIKQEWGQALTSGGYTQRTRWLEADGAHDPLGVLCHLAAKHGVVERVVQDDGRVLYQGPDAEGEGWRTSYSYLPRAAALWARVPIIPLLEVKGAFLPVSALSDAGWGWHEIWALIARQL